MTKMNRKGQMIGSTITMTTATIVIVIVLVVFALASTLFKVEGIKDKAKDISLREQSHESLISLLQAKEGNTNYADLIRLAKSTGLSEQTESKIKDYFNEIYKEAKWGFKAGAVIIYGGAINSQNEAIISLPNSKGIIECQMGVEE